MRRWRRTTAERWIDRAVTVTGEFCVERETINSLATASQCGERPERRAHKAARRPIGDMGRPDYLLVVSS